MLPDWLREIGRTAEPVARFRVLLAGKKAFHWTDLRVDTNPAPEFAVDFRPSGALCGLRNPRGWIRF